MDLSFKSCFILICFQCVWTVIYCVNWYSTEWHHQSRLLEQDKVQSLSLVNAAQNEDFNSTLDELLIPRVPGTEGHRRVRQFITQTMDALGWKVEEDSFRDNTPHGTKKFSNIIATLNPNACRRLVLACHFDSKIMKGRIFLGATDSAVPCSMLIHIARILQPYLKEQKESDNQLTVQFIFFDGEEAFEHWTSKDSLYGSRHLAEKWNKTPFPTSNEAAHCKQEGDFVSVLDSIEVLILLDLLGSNDPTFYNYFPDTGNLYKRFIDIEQRLNMLNLLESNPPELMTRYFENKSTFAVIEDDHLPFMRKGVPVIHVIPSPFPPVWHKESDNRENLHHPTINNLNKIFIIFVAEYLHLNIPDI